MAIIFLSLSLAILLLIVVLGIFKGTSEPRKTEEVSPKTPADIQFPPKPPRGYVS